MLKYLKISNIGPAPMMELEFGERINLLTGDNGLGKSFILDIAWWSLTRRWPAEINPHLPAGLMAMPLQSGKASIEFKIKAKARLVSYRSEFDRRAQAWTGKVGRPLNPGLVLYAQADGGFAVWDPARNYWKTKGNVDVQDRPPAYVFSPQEVWDGLRDAERGLLCNGLVSDWAGWQKEKSSTFEMLCNVLEILSPSSKEKIVPGELTRRNLDDPRDIPTLRMPYNISVPILHVSAGMRRVIALAYLLVWSWQEHIKASQLLDQPASKQIVFLIDEIEAHLHPKWQRAIIKALLNVVNALTSQANVQLVIATHSPLVMASMEPLYNEKSDVWYDLDFVSNSSGTSNVELTKRQFVRRGDVSNWLISEAFDLESPMSAEAEELLHRATAALSDEKFSSDKAKAIDVELRKVLGGTDPFWMRWRYVAEKKGWLS